MEKLSVQRRAKVGGEYGANGEWYEGGKFIATEEHTVKAPPMRHEASVEEMARRDAYLAALADQAARVSAWLAARTAKFSDVLKVLDAWPANSFHGSLASQLRTSGSLSAKQATYVAKAKFGRVNRRNEAEYDALLGALVEEFK